MKTMQYLYAGLWALSITACNSSSSDHKTTPIDSQYQGIWQASAYGEVYQISDNRLNAYRFTESYCLLDESYTDIDTADLEASIKLIDNHQKFELFAGNGTANFSAPNVIFSKVSSLPNACVTALLKQNGDAGYQQNHQQDLAIFHEFFKDHYFDFETKGIDIDNLYQVASQALMDDATDADLINIMVNMVAPLADTHIQVINTEGIDYYNVTNKTTLPEQLVEEFAAFNNIPFPIPETYLNASLVAELNAYITNMYELQWQLVADYALSENSIKSSDNGLIRWFENQGIGYLYIGAMTGYAADLDELSDGENAEQSLANLNAALNVALTDLSQTQGLILDVRTNNGGNDYISLAIASRFAASDNIHAYSKQARDGDHRSELVDVYISASDEVQYLSPIVLLTSANTISAAEVFTLSMKQLPNVTIVGEASQGSFSDILSFPLPNGFEIGLSNEYYLSPEGDWLEYVGVPVDIKVPFFSMNDRENDTDSGIEAAIELLIE